MTSVRVCAVTCDCYIQDPLVRRVAEAAVAGGHEYHVVCSMDEGESEYEFFNGVHVHRIRISTNGKATGRISQMSFGRMLYYWTLFTFLAGIKLARLQGTHKFDVVHVHNLPDYLVFCALVPKMRGARVILEIQDVTPEMMSVKSKGFFRSVTVFLAKVQERVSTAFADHVLTVGWPFETPLLKRGVPQKKLSSVLNSADPNIFMDEKRTEPFMGEPTAERPLVAMYHGTCAARNGLDTAVRAVAKARERAPHLRLHLRVSSGPSAEALKRLAKELGVYDAMTFTSLGPLEEVPVFISSGDIGLIPYPVDGFMELVLPTKAYEYALMRRAIIASDTVAIHSMFQEGSIRLCEPSNPDSFADALVDLYYNPSKRAELIQRAGDDYQTKYRWELMAERYRQLIVTLAKKNSPRGSLKSSSEVAN